MNNPTRIPLACGPCRERATAFVNRLMDAMARRMTVDQQAGAREELELICEQEGVPLHPDFLRSDTNEICEGGDFL